VGRRLGQHFLSDPAILDRIADALSPVVGDIVIEIGPGRGSLTGRIAPRVGRVVAIEKDSSLAARLKEERGAGSEERNIGSNVEVIHGDALKLDWHKLIRESPLPAPCSPLPDAESPLPAPCSPLPDFKVVGNVPYYITTPLIDKALTPPRPNVVVFLVQSEVAERVVAPPGGKTYGALSVGVQSVATVERLFTVRPGSFTPPPNVGSAVVRFSPLAQPLVAETEVSAFRRFVTSVFAQRRKQLIRILRTLTGWERERVGAALCDLGVDTTARPETLPPETFVALFRHVNR
jgi:16S rRNA (adenine1518-N6/adenine1519-N6)-dimethyltransferase